MCKGKPLVLAACPAHPSCSGSTVRAVLDGWIFLIQLHKALNEAGCLVESNPRPISAYLFPECNLTSSLLDSFRALYLMNGATWSSRWRGGATYVITAHHTLKVPLKEAEEVWVSSCKGILENKKSIFPLIAKCPHLMALTSEVSRKWGTQSSQEASF